MCLSGEADCDHRYKQDGVLKKFQKDSDLCGVGIDGFANHLFAAFGMVIPF